MKYFTTVLKKKLKVCVYEIVLGISVQITVTRSFLMMRIYNVVLGHTSARITTRGMHSKFKTLLLLTFHSKSIDIKIETYAHNCQNRKSGNQKHTIFR